MTDPSNDKPDFCVFRRDIDVCYTQNMPAQASVMTELRQACLEVLQTEGLLGANCTVEVRRAEKQPQALGGVGTACLVIIVTVGAKVLDCFLDKTIAKAFDEVWREHAEDAVDRLIEKGLARIRRKANVADAHMSKPGSKAGKPE